MPTLDKNLPSVSPEGSERARFWTAERMRKTGRVAVKAVTGGLVLAVVAACNGKSGRDYTVEEQVARGVDSAITAYDEGSPLYKYETAFVNPDVDESPRESIGGIGMFGLINAVTGTFVTLRVGQDCLSATAYDTSSSVVARGNISAVAALSVDNGSLLIHPAGSMAQPLRFTEQDDRLIPDAETSDTLHAMGCETDSPLVAEYSTNKDYPPEDMGWHTLDVG